MHTTPPINGRLAAIVDASMRKLSSRRSQKDVARRSGMSPTMLSMVRHGRNKCPIQYVAKLADALEVNPRHLLLLALEEHMHQEARDVIVGLLGRLVTDNEMAIIEIIRRASLGRDPGASTVIEMGLTDLFGTR